MIQGRELEGRRIVLLNGPAGVAKSTVGRRLAATARNGACVHGDDLKRFVVSRERGTVRQGLSYVGGAALADVFLDAGSDLVVFEFVFERRVHVERFRGGLRSDVPVHLLTLWAPLETVTARETARADRDRLEDGVAACWEEMAAHLAELGAVIDTRGSADEVLANVQAQLAAGANCATPRSVERGLREPPDRATISQVTRAGVRGSGTEARQVPGGRTI